MKTPYVAFLVWIYVLDALLACAYFYNRIPAGLPNYDRQYELLSAVLVGIFWPVYLAGKVAIYITAP